MTDGFWRFTAPATLVHAYTECSKKVLSATYKLKNSPVEGDFVALRTSVGAFHNAAAFFNGAWLALL